MALSDPLQLIVIAALVIMLLVFGPKKIPEIAKSLGAAKREFDNASKELQQAAGGLHNPTDLLDKLAASGTTPATAGATGQPSPVAQPSDSAEAGTVSSPSSPQAASKSAEELMIEAARKLNIATEGKRIDEIAAEIVAKSQPAKAS